MDVLCIMYRKYSGREIATGGTTITRILFYAMEILCLVAAAEEESNYTQVNLYTLLDFPRFSITSFHFVALGFSVPLTKGYLSIYFYIKTT